MERSDSKTESQIPFHVRGTEPSAQIKPYYRVHSGKPQNNQAQHPIEAALSHANALLQQERESGIEPMLSLVIPTYNAQRWLPGLLDNLFLLQADKEIVIVDDGSTDETLSTVTALGEKHPEITLLKHDTHLGRGAALQTGLAAAFGKVVVVIDGITDIENKDIVMLVKPILAGCCDVVYGSHHILSLPGQESRWVQTIDQLLTGVLNFCTGQHLSNIESPMKAFRRAALEDIRLQTNWQTTDLAMIFRLSKNGRRIYEMPLDSPSEKKSSGRFFWQQAVTAMGLLRHALHF